MAFKKDSGVEMGPATINNISDRLAGVKAGPLPVAAGTGRRAALFTSVRQNLGINEMGLKASQLDMLRERVPDGYRPGKDMSSLVRIQNAAARELAQFPFVRTVTWAP